METNPNLYQSNQQPAKTAPAKEKQQQESQKVKQVNQANNDLFQQLEIINNDGDDSHFNQSSIQYFNHHHNNKGKIINNQLNNPILNQIGEEIEGEDGDVYGYGNVNDNVNDYNYPQQGEVMGMNFQLIIQNNHSNKDNGLVTSIIANRNDQFDNYGFVNIKDHIFLVKFLPLGINNETLNKTNIHNQSTIHNQTKIIGQKQLYPSLHFYNDLSRIDQSQSALIFFLNQQKLAKKNVGKVMPIEKVIGVVEQKNTNLSIIKINNNIINQEEFVNNFNNNKKINIDKISKNINNLTVKHYLNDEANQLTNFLNINNYPSHNSEFILQFTGNNLLLSSIHYPQSNQLQGQPQTISVSENHNINFKAGRLINGVFKIEKQAKEVIDQNNLIFFENNKIKQIIYKADNSNNNSSFINISNDDANKFFKFLNKYKNKEAEIINNSNNVITIKKARNSSFLPDKIVKINYQIIDDIFKNDFIENDNGNNSNKDNNNNKFIVTYFINHNNSLLINKIKPYLDGLKQQNTQQQTQSLLESLAQYSHSINILKQHQPSIFNQLLSHYQNIINQQAIDLEARAILHLFNKVLEDKDGKFTEENKELIKKFFEDNQIKQTAINQDSSNKSNQTNLDLLMLETIKKALSQRNKYDKLCNKINDREDGNGKKKGWRAGQAYKNLKNTLQTLNEDNIKFTTESLRLFNVGNTEVLERDIEKTELIDNHPLFLRAVGNCHLFSLKNISEEDVPNNNILLSKSTHPSRLRAKLFYLDGIRYNNI